TGLSAPGEMEMDGLAAADALAVGLGWVDVFCGDEHAPASSPTTSSIRKLAPAAQLPLDRGGDLISRQVVEAVVVGAHPFREVGARVDGVCLVHRSDAREVLNRGQVAVVACGVDDERIDVLSLDQRRNLLSLDERFLLEHRDVA